MARAIKENESAVLRGLVLDLGADPNPLLPHDPENYDGGDDAGDADGGLDPRRNVIHLVCEYATGDTAETVMDLLRVPGIDPRLLLSTPDRRIRLDADGEPAFGSYPLEYLFEVRLGVTAGVPGAMTVFGWICDRS